MCAEGYRADGELTEAIGDYQKNRSGFPRGKGGEISVKTALVCGISGQDGTYLAELLLKRGYRVVGTSRDVETTSFTGLEKLAIKRDVELITLAPNETNAVFSVLKKYRPDEIYALAGQSSVGLSFELPSQTLESIIFSTLNLLDGIRQLDLGSKLYHASSSECFGRLNRQQATEETPFDPRSPYGVAKASAHMLVRTYREAYSLFAANGQLFNHESPLRPRRFVTRKITSAAARISKGSREALNLGPIDIWRDWGWAPEYVDAMWRMLQLDEPTDFVIATGRSAPLSSFVELAFQTVGLDWTDHVTSNDSLRRPSELDWNGGSPEKAKLLLNWEAQIDLRGVVERMMEAELEEYDRLRG